MEAKKQVDSSVSGSKGSSVSPPQFQEIKKESAFAEWMGRKEESANSFWYSKPYVKDTGSPRKVDANKIQQNYEEVPCQLSSSIYYGGPDVYIRPKNSPKPDYSSYYAGGGEDDSFCKNWWQGSVYY